MREEKKGGEGQEGPDIEDKESTGRTTREGISNTRRITGKRLPR